MAAPFPGRRSIAMVAVASALLTNFSTGQTKTTITHHRTTESNPSSQLADAETAIEKRDYATAQPLLQKIVAADSSNYQAWFDLGFVFHALGKMEDSIAAYRKSVTANPNIFESNLNLGLSLAQSHDPGADQFLRAATKLTPTAHVEEGRARAWISLAHLLEVAQPNDALEAYRQAATLRPGDLEPHLASGSLLEKQSRFDNAAQEYTEALRLDPSSKDALAGLANVFMRAHRYLESEQVLRKLATADPNNGAIHTQLGNVLLAEDKNDEALAELEAGLKLSPADQQARRDLADAYMKAAKYDQAFELYEKLLQFAPNDAELHDNVGKLLLKQHKFPEAQQEFISAVRLKPDFGPAYGDLAAAANENKDYALAIKAADARAKYMPEIPISFFLRATAYDHLHDSKNAVLNYHQFLSLANGKFPDQEWQARQRLIVLEKKR